MAACSRASGPIDSEKSTANTTANESRVRTERGSAMSATNNPSSSNRQIRADIARPRLRPLQPFRHIHHTHSDTAIQANCQGLVNITFRVATSHAIRAA